MLILVKEAGNRTVDSCSWIPSKIWDPHSTIDFVKRSSRRKWISYSKGNSLFGLALCPRRGKNLFTDNLLWLNFSHIGLGLWFVLFMLLSWSRKCWSWEIKITSSQLDSSQGEMAETNEVYGGERWLQSDISGVSFHIHCLFDYSFIFKKIYHVFCSVLCNFHVTTSLFRFAQPTVYYMCWISKLK